jgi:hypothetical protein
MPHWRANLGESTAFYVILQHRKKRNLTNGFPRFCGKPANERQGPWACILIDQGFGDTAPLLA